MGLKTDFDKLNKLSMGLIESDDMVSRFRDLTLIKLINGIQLIIACDSNASNGEKVNDFKKNSYEETTVSVLKVPLMEVIASGGVPLVIVDNLCMEMEPTGKRIISILNAELKRSLPNLNISVTGSTEDNFPTTQSGFGVTVIGLLNPENNRLGTTEKGDLVYCVGYPQSGISEMYYENTYTVCGIETVYSLNQKVEIHEILPVGSKGVLFEANQLAECSGNQFELDKNPDIDVYTSAGSSTAVLFSAKRVVESELSQFVEKPVRKIGKIK